MPPRQLLRNQKNKTMKRLSKCSKKQSALAKTSHPNKSVAALKKEIVCLKRNHSALKLQLQEQKLEYAALNRKYDHLEAETHQLQISNTALKEENRHYEKLIASTEPEIRACMTRMVETSQTLAGLQMAFNRHRSRQQLSKISGSLSKTQSRTYPSIPKSSVKHNKNVLNVAPRRKQAVRPMVQGLQIFTNLTIPLQRISLPIQNSRRNPVPDTEAPQETEVVNIAVEPELPNPMSFEKHRRNLHLVKNIKSKPKHFGVKKDDTRYVKHSGPVCMVPELNFDDSSESEPEMKRLLKPIVLIRDFNVPSSKSEKLSKLDKTLTTSISPKLKLSAGLIDSNLHDPLEGTSKMYSNPSTAIISSSRKSTQAARKRKIYLSDSDSDCESPNTTLATPISQVKKVGTRKLGITLAASRCMNKKQSSEPEGESNCDVLQDAPASNLVSDSLCDVIETNSAETLGTSERGNCDPSPDKSDGVVSGDLEKTQADVEMSPASDE